MRCGQPLPCPPGANRFGTGPLGAYQLRVCERGVSTVEFAMVAPFFLTMLMAIFNLAQMSYGAALLNGAVEEAARSNALETGNTAQADLVVSNMIKAVLVDATITSQRTSYYDFADIGRAEQWNDANASGDCDNSESFVDENGNGDWDADIGADGNGGANDVVIYAVTVSYEPFFPMPMGNDGWGSASLQSTAVRKNQPFARQSAYGTEAGTCD